MDDRNGQEAVVENISENRRAAASTLGNVAALEKAVQSSGHFTTWQASYSTSAASS
jgi:hypothetical protein